MQLRRTLATAPKRCRSSRKSIDQCEVGDLYQGPEGFLAPFRFTKRSSGVKWCATFTDQHRVGEDDVVQRHLEKDRKTF